MLKLYLDSSSSNESLKSLLLTSVGGLELGLLEPGDDEGDQLLADIVHGFLCLGAFDSPFCSVINS